MNLVLLPLHLMLASFSVAARLLLRFFGNRLLKPAAVTVQPDIHYMLIAQCVLQNSELETTHS